MKPPGAHPAKGFAIPERKKYNFVYNPNVLLMGWFCLILIIRGERVFADHQIQRFLCS
jgi:hypothetical protein